MNISVSGLTSAGKTTHSHLIAGQFGIGYISASQLLLNEAAKQRPSSLDSTAAIKNRAFWGTEDAQKLWADQELAAKVDDGLVHLHNESDFPVVFDCLSLPLQDLDSCFSIWLSSDLESRIKKTIVSHGGNINYDDARELLASKDGAIRSDFHERFGVDLSPNGKKYDLVVDISACIETPTVKSSFKSIEYVHTFLQPIIKWILLGDEGSRRRAMRALESVSHSKVVKAPEALVHQERGGS